MTDKKFDEEFEKTRETANYIMNALKEFNKQKEALERGEIVEVWGMKVKRV